jgi:iron complex outermembrane receptor protein
MAQLSAKQILHGSAALIALIGATSANAQDIAPAADSASETLGDIIVSARRKDELLKDVPTSITVFDADKLIQSGISDTADYFLMTPNVSINETGTRGDNAISIRGISNLGGGANSSFALYVDQVNVIPMVSNPQLQDVERIEVLRGPQGTFFGRNAAGGAINITTVAPHDAYEGKAFVELGNFNTYEGGITLNAPVSDTLFVRGTAYYYSTKGSIHNVNPVGGSDDQKNFNGRIALRYVPTDALTVDLSATYADEHSGLETAVPTGKLSVGSIGLWGLNAFAEVPFFPTNRNTVNNNNPKSTDYNYYILNGRVKYDFGAALLTSVTAYAKGNRDQVGDVDATSLDAVNLTRLANAKFFSQELRLASNEGGRLNWTLGGIFVDEKTTGTLDVILGAANPLGAPANTLIRHMDTENANTSWAAFGEVDFDLTDHLTITYGARYSHDNPAQQETSINGTPNGPVTNALPRKSHAFSNLSNKIALTFAVTPQISAYLLGSQGYRAGGVQLDPSLAKTEFSPEKLWNYEAGLKGTVLDGRVRFAASAFYIDWKNLQVRTVVNGLDSNGAFVITTGIENAAKASSRGFELELEAKATDQLKIGGGLGYTNARYDSYTDAVIDGAIAPIDLSGNRLLDAPRLTLNANAQYDFNVLGWGSFVRGEFSHVSSKETSNLVYVPANMFPVPFDFSFPFHVPAFSVWNVRAVAKKGNLDVSAYVENLLDSNYYTGTFDDLFASGVHVRVHPRKVGVRLGVAF